MGFSNPLAGLMRPRMLFIGGIAVGSFSLVVIARMFGWSMLLAVLLVLTLILVAVIVLLVRQLQHAKAAEEIEKTIGHQADRDIERSVPGQVETVKNLKKDLLEAIAALKRSSGGRRGQGVLSTLPWYMLMGPAGAGKSEFMAHSGLHFPLRDAQQRGRAVKGIGGTRAFEWWLSQEAVVLDMGGRTLAANAQFEDNDDWFAFLEVLRRQRPQKPLNGVIVAVPVDQLADRPEAHIDKLAAGVRERVQELVDRLGIVFPVYVVFTKADLVAGFAESFADLPAAERHQAWGATFAVEASAGQPAEELFDEEYSHLVAALSDRRMRRLGSVADPYQRARLFAFPAQLERVRTALRRFVRGAFAPDPTRESALFRGFYLASAGAQGAPTDRVLEPGARVLGIPLGATPAAPPLSGSHFVHDLLTRVVFADAELAGASSRALAKGRRTRYALLGGLGLVLLAFVILFSVFALLNGALVGGTRDAAKEVAERVSPSATLLDNLDALEGLRAKLATVDSLERRGAPLWRQLGGWSGGKVLDPGVRLYTEKALEALIGPGVRSMEVRLDQLTRGDIGDFVDFYTLFRARRLLSKPGELEATDAPLIARALELVTASQLETVAPGERARLPERISDQVAFLAAHPEWMEKLAPAHYRLTDPELVRRAQQILRERWDPVPFYRQLIDQSQAAPAATLQSLAGDLPVLVSSYTVPGAWTRPGWEGQVRPRLAWWRAQTQRDWVLSEAFEGAPPDLAGDLEKLYARDYTDQWVQFLDGLSVKDPGDWAGRSELLKACARRDSPILKTLEAVAGQTLLGADPEVGLGVVREDFAMLHDLFAGGAGTAGRLGGMVSRIFKRDQNRLDQNASGSDLYLRELAAAQKQIEEVAQPASAEETAKKERELYKGGAARGAQAWITEVAGRYGQAAGTGATARVLQLPLPFGVGRGTSPGLLPKSVSEKWSLLVASPFQKTLAGKYPVTAGGPDASLFDFAEFFRPGGTFWSFYNDQLKDYVREDGSPVNPGEAPPLSPAALAAVKKAYEIRLAMFPSGENPSVRFAVRTNPPRIEGPGVNVRWVSFDVGGRFATYSMGQPQFQELEWPGTDPTVGAALRAQLSGGAQADSRNIPGPWGLFKLLDQGQYVSAGDQPQISWRLQAGGSALITTYEIQPASQRHPFRPGFLRFSVPDTP